MINKTPRQDDNVVPKNAENQAENRGAFKTGSKHEGLQKGTSHQKNTEKELACTLMPLLNLLAT